MPNFLVREPSVLVLDNLETLWDDSGPDLDELLQRLIPLPKLRLMVTMSGTINPCSTWRKELLKTLDAESARKVFIDLSGNADLRGDFFEQQFSQIAVQLL